jgi:hypothetical protein
MRDFKTKIKRNLVGQFCDGIRSGKYSVPKTEKDILFIAKEILRDMFRTEYSEIHIDVEGDVAGEFTLRLSSVFDNDILDLMSDFCSRTLKYVCDKTKRDCLSDRELEVIVYLAELFHRRINKSSFNEWPMYFDEDPGVHNFHHVLSSDVFDSDGEGLYFPTDITIHFNEMERTAIDCAIAVFEDIDIEDAMDFQHKDLIMDDLIFEYEPIKIDMEMVETGTTSGFNFEVKPYYFGGKYQKMTGHDKTGKIIEFENRGNSEASILINGERAYLSLKDLSAFLMGIKDIVPKVKARRKGD